MLGRLGGLLSPAPVSGILHCIPDLLPGPRGGPPVLVALPSLAQIRLRLFPGPAHVMPRRLEAIAERGTEMVVPVRPQRVRAAGEALEPGVILGLPGRLPIGVRAGRCRLSVSGFLL